MVSACAEKSNQAPEVRIVDMQGKSHGVKTRVPELNARILESQGRMPQQDSSQFQQREVMQSQAQQGGVKENIVFNNSSAQGIKDTFQAPALSYNLVKKESVVSNNPQDESMTSVGVVGEKEQEIQYDLSESAQNKKAKAGKMKLKVQEQPLKSGVTKSKQKGIFVQTGSFSNQDSAKKVLQETQKFYKGRIEEAQAGEKTIYRVLLGPFASGKKAQDMLLKIKKSGRDAIVVKNR